MNDMPASCSALVAVSGSANSRNANLESGGICTSIMQEPVAEVSSALCLRKKSNITTGEGHDAHCCVKELRHHFLGEAQTRWNAAHVDPSRLSDKRLHLACVCGAYKRCGCGGSSSGGGA
jgi:hypothetical protein